MDLTTLITAISAILVALLFGAMVFFSFVMAPLIFIKLEADVAGRFVRAVFPWYYLMITVLAGLAALSLVGSLPLNAMLLFLVTGSALFCRQILMPRINDWRDRSRNGDKQADRNFNRLHKLSEVINVLQLLAVTAVMLHLVFFIQIN